MPIRPVDLQVMMPKINDVANMQKNEMNRSDALQQQLATTVQREASKATKQVVDASKADEAKIALKEEKKNHREEKKENKKHDTASGENKNLQINQKHNGSTIDIRI